MLVSCFYHQKHSLLKTVSLCEGEESLFVFPELVVSETAFGRTRTDTSSDTSS